MCVGGWEEKWRLRLNSAQFQVKLPAGAELGNRMTLRDADIKIEANKILNEVIEEYWRTNELN